MTGNTHMALGVAAGAVAAGMTGAGSDVTEVTWTVVIASLGSLLPDIDEDGSMLNNLLFKSIQFRSAALAIMGAIFAILYFLKELELWIFFAGIYAMSVAFVPHRSFTHSFLSLFIVTGIMYLAEPRYAPAMAIGYLSHLLADAATSGGIPLFWPWKKRIGLKSLGIKIKSGDTADKVTGKIAMYGGCIALVWMLFQDVSYDTWVTGAVERVETVKNFFSGAQ